MQRPSEQVHPISTNHRSDTALTIAPSRSAAVRGWRRSKVQASFLMTVPVRFPDPVGVGGCLLRSRVFETFFLRLAPLSGTAGPGVPTPDRYECSAVQWHADHAAFQGRDLSGTGLGLRLADERQRLLGGRERIVSSTALESSDPDRGRRACRGRGRPCSSSR
jgi:hypothetical protein